MKFESHVFSSSEGEAPPKSRLIRQIIGAGPKLSLLQIAYHRRGSTFKTLDRAWTVKHHIPKDDEDAPPPTPEQVEHAVTRVVEEVMSVCATYETTTEDKYTWRMHGFEETKPGDPRPLFEISFQVEDVLPELDDDNDDGKHEDGLSQIVQILKAQARLYLVNDREKHRQIMDLVDLVKAMIIPAAEQVSQIAAFSQPSDKHYETEFAKAQLQFQLLVAEAQERGRSERTQTRSQAVSSMVGPLFDGVNLEQLVAFAMHMAEQRAASKAHAPHDGNPHAHTEQPPHHQEETTVQQETLCNHSLALRTIVDRHHAVLSKVFGSRWSQVTVLLHQTSDADVERLADELFERIPEDERKQLEDALLGSGIPPADLLKIKTILGG